MKLNLSGNDIDETGIIYLSEDIHRIPYLKELSLACILFIYLANKLSKEKILTLSSRFKDIPYLCCLDLSRIFKYIQKLN